MSKKKTEENFSPEISHEEAVARNAEGSLPTLNLEDREALKEAAKQWLEERKDIGNCAA